VIQLTLIHVEGKVTPILDNTPLTAPTPLAALPRITGDENPYRYDPIGLGQRLYAAMGGDALLSRLDADPDGALLLVTDEETAKIPWEYAAAPAGAQLAVDYAILRLLPDRPAVPLPQEEKLNFVVLAADPLLDERGNPRTGPKLDIGAELQAIETKLRASGKAVRGRNIPPTVNTCAARW